MKQRMPGKFHYPFHIFGRYTAKDIVRLGIPVTFLYWIAPSLHEEPLIALLLTGGGVVLGYCWYRFRPYGSPVEYLLYHMVRWILVVVRR